MKQTLVQDALKTVQSPQVLVNIISKRVRQLGQGFRPLVAFDPKLTFMDVALKEVAEGKLGYEMIEVPFRRRYALRGAGEEGPQVGCSGLSFFASLTARGRPGNSLPGFLF